MALRGADGRYWSDWTDGSAGRGHSICKSRGLFPRLWGAGEACSRSREKWLEGVVRAECQHPWTHGRGS